MSPATLPRFPSLDLDARRIAATSATIAVHALAFMLLLAPMQWSAPAAVTEPDDPIIVEETRPPVIPPAPPILVQPIRTPPPPTQQPQVMEQLDVAPVDIALTTTDITDSTEGEIGPPVETFEIGPPPTGLQQLAVSFGPAPNYPIQAIRSGIEGRVMLRIDVDANGVPIDGRIEKSSGSTLLDRAALKFVLAKWRFVPATHGGQNIAATALVPVDFVIND
jgi:periplasmic protein TonB